jgi:hypothetical protein
VDRAIGIKDGGLFSQTAIGGEGSIRLREAPIMPQVIGLSSGIKQSIDRAIATLRLAIVAKSRLRSMTSSQNVKSPVSVN